MPHLKRISADKAVTVPDKAVDAGGVLFLQLWFAVMAFILSSGSKD